MGTRILVVEDEAIIAADIRERLLNLGYAVTSAAHSGEEAIKKTEEDGPDLVLMDIMLHGKMDGIEAASQIRSRFNIPVVYLTAYSDEKLLERAKITEPFGYIIKPFNDHELYTNIEMAIYKHKMITERKKAEEIRIENERLAHVSRVKSEFLANMSHELRTPLNAIIGFSEIMKKGTTGELNEEQANCVDFILAAGKHLLLLINDILDLSKVEAGKVELAVEKIPVPEAIDEALILIKERAAKQNVIIRKELDPQLEFMEADKQRLKQILFNLLGNAVKFSKKEGGTVTITVRKEDGMAKFSVSDTGIGIREEDMGQLFKEFRQIDSGINKRYEGTGLGLAITKKLVELHGGRIMAESKYGEGSTFTFFLPLNSKKGEIQ